MEGARSGEMMMTHLGKFLRIKVVIRLLDAHDDLALPGTHNRPEAPLASRAAHLAPHHLAFAA